MASKRCKHVWNHIVNKIGYETIYSRPSARDLKNNGFKDPEGFVSVAIGKRKVTYKPHWRCNVCEKYRIRDNGKLKYPAHLLNWWMEREDEYFEEFIKYIDFGNGKKKCVYAGSRTQLILFET